MEIIGFIDRSCKMMESLCFAPLLAVLTTEFGPPCRGLFVLVGPNWIPAEESASDSPIYVHHFKYFDFTKKNLKMKRNNDLICVNIFGLLLGLIVWALPFWVVISEPTDKKGFNYYSGALQVFKQIYFYHNNLTRRFPTVSYALVPAGAKLADFGLCVSRDSEIVECRG